MGPHANQIREHGPHAQWNVPVGSSGSRGGGGGLGIQSLPDGIGCIAGQLSFGGPEVSGSCDKDIVNNSIWMMRYSRMGTEDIMVMFVAEDAEEAVDQCLSVALEIASRIG